MGVYGIQNKRKNQHHLHCISYNKMSAVIYCVKTSSYSCTIVNVCNTVILYI